MEILGHYETLASGIMLIVCFICGIGFSLILLYDAIKKLKRGFSSDEEDDPYRLIAFILWVYVACILSCVFSILIGNYSLLNFPFIVFATVGIFVLIIGGLALSSKLCELTAKLLKFINGDR